MAETEKEESFQPHKKLMMDSSTGTDIIGIEDQNIDDEAHGIWLEELLQPDIQLIDTEDDTEILCTTAELEVMDNSMYTELVNDKRKIETPIYQPGSKIWKKGRHSQILPSGNVLYTAQTHPACKSINSPGCSDYMKDNVNKDSYQEVRRRNILVGNQGNGGEVTLEYIGPEDADVK